MFPESPAPAPWPGALPSCLSLPGPQALTPLNRSLAVPLPRPFPGSARPAPPSSPTHPPRKDRPNAACSSYLTLDLLYLSPVSAPDFLLFLSTHHILPYIKLHLSTSHRQKADFLDAGTKWFPSALCIKDTTQSWW